MYASAITAFGLVMTLTFDLWHWAPFHQCPLTWWIFVASLNAIPPLCRLFHLNFFAVWNKPDHDADDDDDNDDDSRDKMLIRCNAKVVTVFSISWCLGYFQLQTKILFITVSFGPIFLQCFDTVGWVIWPVKTRPHMTYNVLVGR